MGSRTAYAGIAADGDVYTAANHRRMPGGWIGYTERATDLTGVSNADTEIVNVAVTAGANRLLLVECWAKLRLRMSASPGMAEAQVRLKQDGTQIAVAKWQASVGSTLGTAEEMALVARKVVVGPSAGAHTYSASLFSGSTSYIADVLAGSVGPAAVITVVDLGPSS